MQKEYDELLKYKEVCKQVSKDIYELLTEHHGYDDYYYWILKELDKELYDKCYGESGYQG